MATAVEQLVIDPQSRFLEMKSLQPYSTTDEYLYAMKEDLADWLSNMYSEWRPITADNFIQCLENGVLLCQHANNVNNAARKAYSLKLAPRPLTLTLENCKYRSDARPQTFNARDNVSQFIKWARRVVGVREVLMFESDDLILRKNEKNFLLCLLEIARYGSQFGVSVPVIIKLEDEIEREIQRDKQTEIMSFTELRRLQREENLKNISNSSHHGKYSRLLKFVRNESLDSNNNNSETTKNSYNSFSLSHSNGANWLRQRISRIPKFTHTNSKKRQDSGESHDNSTWSDATITAITLNKEQKIPQISRTLGEGENRVETPTTSSQLHKTVVQMTNSCCCAQRFPVIRIGEGKYRIGESGTIIFIRILRYHVMVRVGGGWDTLENYLNKHDPCRRTGHRRLEPNEHHIDIPILAVPTNNVSSSFQKTTPYGKSVTIKTEEYPLSKLTMHDTNLINAQLIITRDADGRHHIGQITYKSEDNLNQLHSCPQHHNKQSSPIPKVKSVRGTGRLITSSIYDKQSLTSTDQDYSSYTPTLSIETNRSNVSTSDSQQYKTDSIIEQHSQSKILKHTSKENQQKLTSINKKSQLAGFTESYIDNIDDFMPSTLDECEHDFDISDIDDVMQINNHDEDRTNIDEDSLESCEGVLEINKKSISPSRPIISDIKPIISNVKPGGICTALYLAQKQKQASNNKKLSSTFLYTRSNTLPNVIEAINKENQINKRHRKTAVVTQRSQSTELFDKSFLNDTSKLDRDSGFDEQDFRCERSHSSYDDNSSISSIKSVRSSMARSLSSDLNGQAYRENKAYELRLKALDYTKILNEQVIQDPRLNIRRNFNYTSTRTNDTIHPTTHKYRKNSQSNFYLKRQQF
ncbi:unnamed protein product [Rotaria sp. Silwood1]|nr:unnamed protein product [Rotaria sp. Silwood1]CAF1108356.1 unnamed protein product [Rotaria sp. Silwood1]CAF3418868.1 unnamed protein product [Rotaria sp. Silwood1]CAF3473464.1 unnamed protein product [Rotaria sp. Silwood1]CAF4538924.1 unnamed protein product [Rotaria sp. Silwood1]